MRAILLHNMREEMEHASMVLEWIRRNNSDFAEPHEDLSLHHRVDSAVEKAATAPAEGAAVAGTAPPAGRRASGFTVGPLKGE